LGNYLPGDVATYSSLAYSYKPRKTAQVVTPREAVGQYLEQPALHHTIGTRITKKMADQLKKYGVESVMAHRDAPGFEPNMVSLVKAPQFKDDWMARLSSNYLKTRLLEDIQRGSESKIHGLHPAPGIAKGIEFGQQKGKGFTF